MLSRWVWRNDGLYFALEEDISEPPRVVGAISEQSARRLDELQEVVGTVEIVSIAGGDQQRDRTAVIVGQCVDFCRPAATRASDRLAERPPFAPAAERCALMWVESSDIDPTMPVLPVKA